MEDSGNPQLEESEVGDDVINDVIIEACYDAGDSEEYLESEISSPAPVTVMVEQEEEENEDQSETNVVNVIVEDSTEEITVARTRKRRGNAKFLDKGTILKMLLESKSTMEKAPAGPKVGQHFVLDDDKNFFKGRRKAGKNTFPVDEYDKWENVSLKRHYYFYCKGRFKYVDYIGGEYHLHAPSPGSKGSKKPMIKQPKDDEILVMRKMYGLVPGVVKRRICYIEKLPKGVVPKQHNLILAEYCEALEEFSTAKLVKLETNDNEELQFGDEIENVQGEQSEMVHIDSANLEEVGVKTIGENQGMFFTRDEAIDILLKAEAALEEIPAGVKENEYFIVNNEENYQRWLQGKRRMYIDDCGVWKNISMKSQKCVRIDNTYVYVDHSNGKYKLSNTQLRLKHEPPKQSDVLIMRKVYGCLRRDEEYKRRISWIDTFPKGVVPRRQHIALVEYTGKYPEHDELHGNQKKEGGDPYVRTPLRVMKKMKEMLAQKTAKQVMEECQEIGVSPRGLRQLNNMRYRNNYRISPGAARDKTHTEELKEILSMVQTNPFVQQVTYMKHKAPVVICYTNQQMNSWKYHCQERSGLNRVLGVDRTINLGPVCLTILTYPHPNLLNRRTDEQAIMMGPVFFHVDKSWHSFSLLFNHIKMCLTTAGNANVDHIGIACQSEEEKEITQALKISFPNSTIALCPEHLKMDLTAFLLTEVSLSNSMADKILDEIFSGLMECSEEYDFDMKLLQLQSEYDSSIPQFGEYFGKLAENIRHSLWRPTMERTPILKWSPDSCEALSNLLTSARTWDRPSLPELISKLQEIIQHQEQEEVSALHNEGCYVLAPHARKYYVAKSEYAKKTPKQKGRVAENLRKFKPGSSKIAMASLTSSKHDNENWEESRFY